MRKDLSQYFKSKAFETSRSFSSDYSSEPVQKALKKIFQPQLSYKTIHIAGTVAKGSLTYLLSEMLISQKLKVGSFYSPHLISLNERIQINHEEIDDKSFHSLWSFLESQFKIDELSFFDCTTIIAFMYFKGKNVDWAVIETGLGGRKDSTNNLNPVFSVITPIGLDHQSILGNSIQEIASEKAGIIHGQTIFSYPQSPKAAKVLKKEAEAQGSQISFYSSDPDYEQKNYLEKNLAVCNWVYSEYFGKPAPEIDFKLKARLEVLSRSPYIVFDGAHNALGMKAIAEWLSQETQEDEIKNKKWVIYINTLKDRKLPQFVDILLNHCQDKIEKICFFPVTDEDKDRFYSTKNGSAKSSGILNKIHSFKEEKELIDALSDHEKAHLICGSMYLYAKCKEIIQENILKS